MKKIIIVIAVIVMIPITTTANSVIAAGPAIYITDNAFEGFEGEGTKDSPFIIKKGLTGHPSILIENCSMFWKIEKQTFEGLASIAIVETSNGIIENNQFSQKKGSSALTLLVINSSNITFRDNEISGNGWAIEARHNTGVKVINSSSIIISNNNFSNLLYGISSKNVTGLISNNTFHNCYKDIFGNIKKMTDTPTEIKETTIIVTIKDGMIKITSVPIPIISTIIAICYSGYKKKTI